MLPLPQCAQFIKKCKGAFSNIYQQNGKVPHGKIKIWNLLKKRAQTKWCGFMTSSCLRNQMRNIPYILLKIFCVCGELCVTKIINSLQWFLYLYYGIYRILLLALSFYSHFNGFVFHNDLSPAHSSHYYMVIFLYILLCCVCLSALLR